MADRSAPSRVDQAIAEFAKRRWGVFLLTDVRPLGLSGDMASDRVKAGRLFRLHIGVYSIIPPSFLRAEGRWLAAVLACGPGAVLSHTNAAALWDLRHRPSGPIHVTVPTRAGRRKRPEITIHRSSTLLTSHATLRRAIPVTTAARTLADIRRLIPADDYERVRSRALDRHFDLGALGDGALPSRSELEHRLRSLCRRHGLPAPLGQQQLGPYTVDFLWPDARLVVEVDDFETHGPRQGFESDRARDAWLVVHGYRVVRFTWRQLTRDTATVVTTVRRLLGLA